MYGGSSDTVGDSASDAVMDSVSDVVMDSASDVVMKSKSVVSISRSVEGADGAILSNRLVSLPL